MSTVYMHTYSRRIYYKYVLQVVARLVKAERIATHCIEEVALLTKEWETAHAYVTSRVVFPKSKTSTPISDDDCITHFVRKCLGRWETILDALSTGTFVPGENLSFILSANMNEFDD